MTDSWCIALPLLPVPLLIVTLFLLLRAETRTPRSKPQVKLRGGEFAQHAARASCHCVVGLRSSAFRR